MRNVNIATAMVRLACHRLLRKYPFYGAIASSGLFEAAPIGTMAVTIRAGRLIFLFDPEFVVTHDLDVIVGGLQHEVLHVVFEHLTADLRRYSDVEARTVAEEVTMNEFVCEPLPAGVLRHREFGLPDDEDTETRYARLAQTNPHPPGSDALRANSRNDTPISFDVHSVWPVGDADANAVVTQVVAAAYRRVSGVEWARVPAAVRARVAELLPMTEAPRVSSCITASSAVLPWLRILENDVEPIIERVPTFGRGNRRFRDLTGIIPGKRIATARPRALAVIDSSGSITDAMLAQITAELTTLARCARVTVCECDTKVQRTYAYTAPATEVLGRGATDLRPPFDAAYLQKQRPDVVVVFSDGLGPVPDEPPHVPVIWVVMAGGRVPAKWGRAVRLPTPAANLQD